MTTEQSVTNNATNQSTSSRASLSATQNVSSIESSIQETVSTNLAGSHLPTVTNVEVVDLTFSSTDTLETQISARLQTEQIHSNSNIDEGKKNHLILTFNTLINCLKFYC